MFWLQKKSILFGFILVVLTISLAVFFRSSGEHKEEVQSEPGISFENIRLVGRNDGTRQWEISSRSLRQEEDIVHFEQLEEMILLKDDRPKYFVKAESGIWNKYLDTLHLQNNVVVEDNEGFSLATSNLIWHAGEQRFEITGDTVMVFK